MEAINIAEKLASFAETWAPKIICEMNDYHVKLAKLKGEFIWHNHPTTDELFFVIDGKLTIQFRDREIDLKSGEMCVVPRGIEHRPVAEELCQIMLIEPAGTRNTGELLDELTANDDVWI